MESRIITTQKGVIEYTSIGKGQALLFAHGGHFNCQVTLFHKGFDTGRFNIITPSRPGYGHTPLAGNESPRKTAQLFIALLDALGIRQAIVIGISAGGLTAIELAANFPERISKLVLISTIAQEWIPRHVSIYMKGKIIFKPPVEKFSWKLLNLLCCFFPWLVAAIIFREVSTVRPPEMTRAEVEELKAMIKKQRSYYGFENDLHQSLEQDAFQKVVCPTLILHSINDNVVGPEHPQHAAEHIPHAILKMYPNRWGHILWLGKESAGPIQDTLNFIQS